ncbi:GH-E family nuclease [Paraburkholderia agricolaris]
MGAATSSVIGSLLAPAGNLTASEREARDNLVTSLIAGIAATSGLNAATATGAGKIEVENNQVSLTTTTGFRLPPIPGFKGETASKGDGVIADPATELDPSTKPGSLISPLPDAKTVGDWITAIIPDQAKDLVDYFFTAVNSRPSGFRKQTIQDAWDKASDGSQPDTKACPTCGRDVAVAPGQGPRDWDVDHQPPWSTRDTSDMTRSEVIDEYNKDTRLECPGCNRSRGAKPTGQ